METNYYVYKTCLYQNPNQKLISIYKNMDNAMTFLKEKYNEIIHEYHPQYIASLHNINHELHIYRTNSCSNGRLETYEDKIKYIFQDKYHIEEVEIYSQFQPETQELEQSYDSDQVQLDSSEQNSDLVDLSRVDDLTKLSLLKILNKI
ncbi:hypothetical protein LCGC14_1903640 [marine sediment metagenome]|uniref:Uncharacterized protein n=1 Tax=marine sediment metagenome TaxID=412755 RepID=A0A0F9ITW3_9ZZZZ